VQIFGIPKNQNLRSPYGASTIADPMGERMLSANELKLAKGLGKHLNSNSEETISLKQIVESIARKEISVIFFFLGLTSG
jgi:hypothetical protein